MMRTDPSIGALKLFIRTNSALGFNSRDPEAAPTGLRAPYFSVQPRAFYDSNPNGGNPSDTLDLGNGLIFTFPQDSLAKPAPVLGSSVGMGGKIGYARGKYLDLNASLSGGYSIGAFDPQSDWALSACSRNHLGGWSFLDICANRTGSNRKLSASLSSRIEARFTQLGLVLDHPVEFTGLAFRQDQSGQWLPGAGVEVKALVGESSALGLGIESEWAAAGQPHQAYDAYVSLSSQFWNRDIDLRLSRSLSLDGQILGLGHDDQTTGLSVTVPVKPGVSLSAGYTLTDSTVDFYDQGSFSFSLILAGLRK